MSRLTDNDINFGRYTFAPWKGRFGITLEGRGDEEPHNQLLITGFGWAMRVYLPSLIKPFGKYGEYRREYGISLSDMGNGYDFLQIFYGPQTHDSDTEKSWSKHIPWKQWRCVRNCVYTPDGELFAKEDRGKGSFFAFMEEKRACPSVKFDFEDYDGKRITATCVVELREWHKGEGWFKWVGWFCRPMVRRSLDLQFSAEVGPEKGSWKGGTIGHGIDMKEGETPRQAFERYCDQEHNARHGRKYKIKFLGEWVPNPAWDTATHNADLSPRGDQEK